MSFLPGRAPQAPRRVPPRRGRPARRLGNVPCGGRQPKPGIWKMGATSHSSR